jgi:hypothetical protein
MRKRIILAAMAAAAVIVFAWSISTLARPKVVAGKGEVTETSAPISPHDITVKQGNMQPVEYWAHPF